VIGAGGLGSPLIHYLGAAGVGAIGIVNDDVVSLSNLQRQVIQGTSAVGCLKVESAANVVGRLNPHVMIEAYPIRLSDACERAIFNQSLRPCTRSIGYFRYPLHSLACLFDGEKAAGDCSSRPVRWVVDHRQGP
jgi:shikimate 5-dehydrogenase